MYHPPRSGSSYDPNHPPELDISASHGPRADEHEQQRNIGIYGIAGRVWDASYPILPYLTTPEETHLDFQPPCSIFRHAHVPPVILELGSGQSLASLHLLTQLHQSPTLDATSRPRVYLTDLENVVPLVAENLSRWRETYDADPAVDVFPCALPWGDLSAADELLRRSGLENLGITHILMIDLIYFPHLYPLLLQTLRYITEPPFSVPDTGEDATTGPEIILSYKSRSLAYEEPFFQSFQQDFQITPLLSRPRRGEGSAGWTPHGGEDGVVTYLCRRRRRAVPDAGDGAAGAGGAGWGYAEALLGAIEWD